MKAIEEETSVTISVRVTPRSSRSEIIGFDNDILKIRLAAPPVDGAANDELVKLLARSFGVSRSAIDIVSGGTSRNKIVRIFSIAEGDFAASLGRILA